MWTWGRLIGDNRKVLRVKKPERGFRRAFVQFSVRSFRKISDFPRRMKSRSWLVGFQTLGVTKIGCQEPSGDFQLLLRNFRDSLYQQIIGLSAQVVKGSNEQLSFKN